MRPAPRRLVWEGAHLRPYRLGKVGQDTGIEGIGLGQLPCSSGKVSHLARVYHCHGQRGSQQLCHHWRLQTAHGFQHHERYLGLLDAPDERGDPRSSLLTRPESDTGRVAKSRRSLEASTPSNVAGNTSDLLQPLAAVVQPCTDARCDTGNCSGFSGEAGRGVTTRLSRGRYDPGCNGLSRPHHAFPQLYL